MVISRQLCLTVGLGPTRQEGATDHQYHSAHCQSVDVVALNHDSQTERHHGDQVGDERGSMEPTRPTRVPIMRKARPVPTRPKTAMERAGTTATSEDGRPTKPNGSVQRVAKASILAIRGREP